MLAYFAGDDSTAALDRVATDFGLCFELPMIEELCGARFELAIAPELEATLSAAVDVEATLDEQQNENSDHKPQKRQEPIHRAHPHLSRYRSTLGSGQE